MYNHCVALKPITKPLSQGRWGRQEPTKLEPNRRQVTEKGMVFKTLQWGAATHPLPNTYALIRPAKATPYQPDKEAKCSKEEKGQRVKKIKKQNRQRKVNKHNQSCKKAEANKWCNHNTEEAKKFWQELEVCEETCTAQTIWWKFHQVVVLWHQTWQCNY